MVDGSTLGLILGYTDDKAIVSYEGMLLGYTDVELLDSTLGLDDGVTLGVDDRYELDYYDVSLYGSNDGKPVGFLISVLFE